MEPSNAKMWQAEISANKFNPWGGNFGQLDSISDAWTKCN